MHKRASKGKAPSEAHLFPVCGLFCGQRQKLKFKPPEIVAKSKENVRFSSKKRTFCGAAGRIRTADLILTKRPKHILRSTHSSLYVSCNPCAARVFWHVISWLVPFCPLRFYLIPAVCWKNVGKQMFCTLDYRPIKIGAVPRRTTDHIRRSHGPTGRDKIPRSFSP